MSKPRAQVADANCDRCGRPLRLATKRREDSAPFRLAKVPKGVCPDCVVTQFLYDTYPVNMIIDEAGPEMLLNAEFMRMAFTSSGILKNCDLKIEEIDWQRVVDNWNLPVKVKKSALNPYRMGESPRSHTRRGETPASAPFGEFGGPSIFEATGTLMVTRDPKTGKLLANGKPFSEHEKTELGDAIEDLLGALHKEERKQ